jgi:hypothetical protein
MKRKFKVTITYDVELDDPDANDDVTIGSVAGLHIMDAVYASQGGSDRGMTSVKPELAYVTTEEKMSWQEVK